MVEQWFPKNTPPSPLKRSLDVHLSSFARSKSQIPESLPQLPMDKGQSCQPFISTAQRCATIEVLAYCYKQLCIGNSLMITHLRIKYHVLLPSLDLDKVCNMRQGGPPLHVRDSSSYINVTALILLSIPIGQDCTTSVLVQLVTHCGITYYSICISLLFTEIQFACRATN